MSNIEIKYALRKIDFPNCAREAIHKIENLIVGRTPNIKHVDLSMDIMAEFIFCEKDRRGNKRSTELTSFQELQLLEILIEYFLQPGTELSKNTIFLLLFGPSYVQMRLKMLCKLVSIAISSSSASALIAAGVWMQQVGCTSSPSLYLAKAIVEDYFSLVHNVSFCLKQLPVIAPQFTANFLTAVAEIHLVDKRSTFTPPPQNLLQVIVDWVCENPTLCLASQLNTAALPYGSIAMATITPIAGLFKWCILSPLYYLSSGQDESNTKNKNKIILDLYGQLHLALLETLSEVEPGQGLPNVVSAQHLSDVILLIQAHVTETMKVGKSFEMEKSGQIALERLAQAVQVSIATYSMYGNTQDLFNQLNQLPKNKLLSIIINAHKHLQI